MTSNSSFPDSETGQLEPSMRVLSQIDFSRLERKVDKLADAIGKLVIVEERQANQTAAILELRNSLEIVKINAEKNFEINRVAIGNLKEIVSAWINRGIGIWAIVGVLYAIAKFVYHIG